jgi:hypothetical protein
VYFGNMFRILKSHHTSKDLNAYTDYPNWYVVLGYVLYNFYFFDDKIFPIMINFVGIEKNNYVLIHGHILKLILDVNLKGSKLI